MTPFVSTENIRLGPVLMDRESVTTASCSPVSPFLRFVVTEPSRMKSVRTEGCHVGAFREFVGKACCTYGQSNTTTNMGSSSGVVVRSKGAYGRLSGHPAGPVLGWVARVEYPVPKHYTLPGCSVWISRIILMAPHRPSDET